jgi:hypothetical protein
MVSTEIIEKNFPFLSIVKYGGEEYIGVIINQDQYITSMYVYNNMKTDAEKKTFLELGHTWWWETNRMFPINIFLKRDLEPFKQYIISMNTKDAKVILGPALSINDLIVKRVKRKSIQLVRRPPD